MAEPLKAFFSPALVQNIGASLARVHPAFPRQMFVRDATRGIEALELLDRARHVARALAKHLPQRYPEAISILVASLGPEHDRDELTGAGMAPFFYLPHTIFVAERGLDDFERSMAAQREITKRFTAEFSIRPFLDRYPERTLAVLDQWAMDPNPHVRRLVSEGTRPRLPWAPRVAFLDKHPEAALPLLEKLKDDPTTLVRRSVANHLNDIAKDHPHVVAEWLERHLPAASPQRRALLKHASRTLVKRGDRRVLAAWGLGAALRGDASLTIEPKTARIGDAVTLRVVLRSTATKPQRLVVDYAVHHVKANGAARPKVWKGWSLELPPRGARELERRHSLAVVTTRRLHPGRHAVDLLVNGEVVASSAFTLRA